MMVRVGGRANVCHPHQHLLATCWSWREGALLLWVDTRGGSHLRRTWHALRAGREGGLSCCGQR